MSTEQAAPLPEPTLEPGSRATQPGPLGSGGIPAPFVVLGNRTDLFPGWRRTVTVGSTAVLVHAEADGVHAIADTCPHYQVALHTGRRRGDYVECPWHHWLINLRTGECMHNPRIKNRTFDVVLHNDQWVVFGDPDLDAPESGDHAARTDANSEGDQR